MGFGAYHVKVNTDVDRVDSVFLERLLFLDKCFRGLEQLVTITLSNQNHRRDILRF
jgi:hypothetical protein